MSNKSTIVYSMGLVAIVLELVAIIQPNWMKQSSSGVAAYETNVGLWKTCGKGGGIDMCENIPIGQNKNFPKHSLEACRILAVLGIVLSFLGLLCVCLCRPENKGVQMSLLILGGLCSIIASIVWSSELLKIKNEQGETNNFKPDYSLYLNLVGGVLSLGMAGYIQYKN